MKSKLLILLVFAFSLSVFSQKETQVLVGKILEFQNPISGAHIYNLNRLNGAFSRDNGVFEIQVTLNDTLIISHIKYKTQRLIVTENYLNYELPIKIYLEEMTNYLDVVNIKNHNLSGTIEIDSNNASKNQNKDSINNDSRNLANQTPNIDMGKHFIEPINNTDPTGNSTVNISTAIPMKFKDIEERKVLKNKRDFPDRIISDLGTSYFTNTLHIPSEKIHHFLTYCDSKNIIDLYYKNDMMHVLAILQEESMEYVKIED
ncbi:MAG: hypothetical protein KAH07_03125 [Flavobacteriaceae bacterium]|nr:hypothetical protein [Flavobacteriaceae bacterium]